MLVLHINFLILNLVKVILKMIIVKITLIHNIQTAATCQSYDFINFIPSQLVYTEPLNKNTVVCYDVQFLFSLGYFSPSNLNFRAD